MSYLELILYICEKTFSCLFITGDREQFGCSIYVGVDVFKFYLNARSFIGIDEAKCYLLQ